MEHTIPAKPSGERLRDRVDVDRTIDSLREENVQLRELVILLTTLVVRNVVGRK
jgi:hypothetical protein